MSPTPYSAALVLLPALAWCETFDWIDLSAGTQPVAIGAGPRALGMGGAFSAVADDATASTWNPAGLTQCERPELAASLGFYRTRIQIDDHETEADWSPEHLSALAPFYAFGCQQVVGIAWQRTYDFSARVQESSYDVSDDGMGTVVTVDHTGELSRDGSFATLGASYGIEVAPGLSFGATLNQWRDSWTRSSHYREQLVDVESTIFDFSGMVFSDERTTVRTHDVRILGGTSLVLGAMWQAMPELTLAVVAKPGFDLELETVSTVVQTIDYGFGPEPPVTTQGTSRSTLHQPTSATLGTAWRPDDLNTLTCDATWTRWRQYYLEQGGYRVSPVAFHVDPQDFDDLWTLRLGYERVCILPGSVLVPRCGALAEWLPAQTTAPDISHAEDVQATSDLWLGATVGLSWCLRSVIWDAGLQVRHGNDVLAGQVAGPTRSADVTIATLRLGATIQF